MSFRFLGGLVFAGSAILLGACGSSSLVVELLEQQNDLARETCDCFYDEEGYASARECREEEVFPIFGSSGCEGRAYRADETGEVRANAECQVEVRSAQVRCYRDADCDPVAFDECDTEAFSALAACPTVSSEAQMAFNDALEECLFGSSGPAINGCPDDDAGSAVGSPAVLGSTEGSDNDLESNCGGDLASDEVIEWVAPQTGTVTIDTFGSDFDTILYVLEASCNGTELTCNDDSFSSSGFQSEVTLAVTQGETLLIVVDGWATDEGSFVLNIEYGP